MGRTSLWDSDPDRAERPPSCVRLVPSWAPAGQVGSAPPGHVSSAERAGPGQATPRPHLDRSAERAGPRQATPRPHLGRSAERPGTSAPRNGLAPARPLRGPTSTAPRNGPAPPVRVRSAPPGDVSSAERAGPRQAAPGPHLGLSAAPPLRGSRLAAPRHPLPASAPRNGPAPASPRQPRGTARPPPGHSAREATTEVIPSGS